MRSRTHWWRRSVERFGVAALAAALLVGCGGTSTSVSTTAAGEVEWACHIVQDGQGGLSFECDPRIGQQVLDLMKPEDRPVTTTVREVPGSRPFLTDFSIDEFERVERTVASGEYAIVPDLDYLRQLERWADDVGIEAARVGQVFKLPKPQTVPICTIKKAGRFPVLVCR